MSGCLGSGVNVIVKLWIEDGGRFLRMFGVLFICGSVWEKRKSLWELTCGGKERASGLFREEERGQRGQA